MSGLAEAFLAFCVGLLVYTLSLWIGARITKADANFLELFVISAIASAAGMVPGAGWILSTIVFYGLLWKLLGIAPIPDALLMVIVATGLRFVLIFSFLQLFPPAAVE